MRQYAVPVPDRIHINREPLARLLQTTVAFATVVCASVAPVAAQTASGSVDASRSYQYLSQDARNLVDRFLAEKGLPQGARGYNSLRKSRRTTFEAIVNALYAQGIFAIVDEVTGIWGEDQQSSDGKDQFRISVRLARGAVEFLLSHRHYYKAPFGWGHVKKPSGDVVEWRDADSVRQRGRRPGLQISWLEDDDTIGEIDIDYREDYEDHGGAANSDIQASSDGEPHLDRHRERYRLPPDLNPWWRDTQ